MSSKTREQNSTVRTNICRSKSRPGKISQIREVVCCIMTQFALRLFEANPSNFYAERTSLKLIEQNDTSLFLFTNLPLKGRERILSPSFLTKCHTYLTANSTYKQFKWEVSVTKASSLHGIVRPPIWWLKPNSSSALLSKLWNNGCFK